MTTLTAISATRIMFTTAEHTGSWDATRPVGERFHVAGTTITHSADVAGFLAALTGGDTAGAQPAHRVLLAEFLQHFNFTSLAHARGAFNELLHDPEMCFHMLNTTPVPNPDIFERALHADSVLLYLVRLAVHHGFLHVMYADDLIEAVEHYHQDQHLSDAQAADLLTLLLLFTPTDSDLWDNRNLATFVSALALIIGFDQVAITEDHMMLAWILDMVHDGQYWGMPYQPAPEPPATHCDTLAALLLVMMARHTGMCDPDDERVFILLDAAHEAQWHTRTMTPLMVGYLVRLWAVHEWLCASEPNDDIRQHAITALAQVSWYQDRSPEQVSIHATTAHTAASLGWSMSRTQQALQLIDDIGPGCTVEDMVHVIDYLNTED